MHKVNSYRKQSWLSSDNMFKLGLSSFIISMLALVFAMLLSTFGMHAVADVVGAIGILLATLSAALLLVWVLYALWTDRP